MRTNVIAKISGSSFPASPELLCGYFGSYASYMKAGSSGACVNLEKKQKKKYDAVGICKCTYLCLLVCCFEAKGQKLNIRAKVLIQMYTKVHYSNLRMVGVYIIYNKCYGSFPKVVQSNLPVNKNEILRF